MSESSLLNGADRDRRARLAVTLLAWLWAGLVLGVSFVATPVKFLAPSLSLADALAVGRVTFEALKWIECVAVVALGVLVWTTGSRRRSLPVLGAIITVLVCQYVWMLPILDARAQTIIAGRDLSASSLHWIYTVLEFLKIGMLVALGLVGLGDSERR